MSQGAGYNALYLLTRFVLKITAATDFRVRFIRNFITRALYLYLRILSIYFGRDRHDAADVLKKMCAYFPDGGIPARPHANGVCGRPEEKLSTISRYVLLLHLFVVLAFLLRYE